MDAACRPAHLVRRALRDRSDHRARVDAARQARPPLDLVGVHGRRRRRVRADGARLRGDPHEWITFSDKYLQWDTTKFVFRSHQDVFGLGLVNWPFNFDMHDIRDIIVVGIYVIVLVLNVMLFVDVAEAGLGGRRARRGVHHEVALRTPAAPPCRAAGDRWKRSLMARTDANPPMPDFATDYVLQEVDPAYLTEAVKPKQFLHIDQAECITVRGLRRHLPVEVHPHGVGRRHRRRRQHRAARRGPPRPRGVHRRRGRVHPLRALRRPLPHRRDRARQDRRPTSPTAIRTPAPTARLRLRRAASDDRHRLEAEQVRGQRQRTTETGRRHQGRRARWTKVDEKVRGSQAWNVDLPAGLGVPARATPTAPGTAPT